MFEVSNTLGLSLNFNEIVSIEQQTLRGQGNGKDTII